MQQPTVDRCPLTGPDGNFFDITHSFNIGSATYHILGLRKDRPTYDHTYYIFECTCNNCNSTHQSTSKSRSVNEYSSSHEAYRSRYDRPGSAHVSFNTGTDGQNAGPLRKRHSASHHHHHHTRTDVSKSAEIDVTAMQESMIKTMKLERQTIVTSLRNEMNMKKKELLRSIKKGNKLLLKATTDASEKEEIIRLLETQKTVLADAYAETIRSTTSLIDTFKQTVLETLNAHHQASESRDDLQENLMKAIDRDVKKILQKNDELLASAKSETNSIAQLQHTLAEKMNGASNASQLQAAQIEQLFSEQKQVLTNVVIQQQTRHQGQAFPLDLIKQTVLDALHEQRPVPATAVAVKPPVVSPATPTGDLQVETPISTDLVSVKAQDHQLLKVSVHSPEPVRVFAKLAINGKKRNQTGHTLCQQDPVRKNIVDCYVVPPESEGPYEVTIYAKTRKESVYRAAIAIQVPRANAPRSITFPHMEPAFEEHQCILIEPLHGQLRRNQKVLIHMVVPDAQTVKLRNGDQLVELDGNDFKDGVIRKKIQVKGDVQVVGSWKKNVDTPVCLFNVV